MKFIKHRTSMPKDEFLELLKDSERVNKNVVFKERRGTPHMRIQENGDSLKMTCEFIGGPSKDSAFLGGTTFKGKIEQKDGYTEIRGIITTDLIFHLVLLLMFAAFIVMCIVRQGFNVVPVCIVVFDILMYKDEFKKQGIIERYIARAVKRSQITRDK